MNWDIQYSYIDQVNDVELLVRPVQVYHNKVWHWCLYDIAEDGYCIAMSGVPGWSNPDDAKVAVEAAYADWLTHYKNTGERDLPSNRQVQPIITE
jgi:hypothetical protein